MSFPMLGGGTLISSALLGPWLLRDSAPPLVTTSSMVYLMIMVSFMRKPRAGSSRMLRCAGNGRCVASTGKGVIEGWPPQALCDKQHPAVLLTWWLHHLCCAGTWPHQATIKLFPVLSSAITSSRRDNKAVLQHSAGPQLQSLRHLICHISGRQPTLTNFL